MLRLVADAGSVRQAEGLANFIGNIGDLFRSGDKWRIAEEVRAGFARNFRSQSAGTGVRWQALALVTQHERQRQGFGARRPILVRTGAYRDSLINSGNPFHYSKTGPLVAGFFVEEGAEGILVTYHEGGTSRMPARPATQLSAVSQNSLGQVIDRLIRGLERQLLS